MADELLNEVAEGMFPKSFELWRSDYDYKIKEGATSEEAKEFADWCDAGRHPLSTVKHAKRIAQSAIDIMQKREAELVEAATGVLLWVQPFHEKNENNRDQSLIETWRVKQLAEALRTNHQKKAEVSNHSYDALAAASKAGEKRLTALRNVTLAKHQKKGGE